MLKLKDINLSLNKGSKLERQIIKNLNLNVATKDFIVVIGGNGAGKSTFLNIISGSLKPDSGKIILNDNDITSNNQYLRAASIAKVMQDPKLGTIENMTISENLALALKRGQSRNFTIFKNRQRKNLYKEKLAMLNMGLENRLNDLVSNLSGGQRQALSLIMAVIADSKILLLDEITAALDPKAAENIMELTNRIILEESRTCIMITHNMSHAIKYGNRLLILKNGTFNKEYNAIEKQNLTTPILAAEFEN